LLRQHDCISLMPHIYGACIGKRFCYDSMLLTFSIWLPRGNVDKEVE
jgi:hypothetical protein